MFSPRAQLNMYCGDLTQVVRLTQQLLFPLSRLPSTRMCAIDQKKNRELEKFLLFSRWTVDFSHPPTMTLPGKEMKLFQKQVKTEPLRSSPLPCPPLPSSPFLCLINNEMLFGVHFLFKYEVLAKWLIGRSSLQAFRLAVSEKPTKQWSPQVAFLEPMVSTGHHSLVYRARPVQTQILPGLSNRANGKHSQNVLGVA